MQLDNGRKMPLTEDIAEGVIAKLIFNGYGLAVYGRVGFLLCFGVAVGIY